MGLKLKLFRSIHEANMNLNSTIFAGDTVLVNGDPYDVCKIPGMGTALRARNHTVPEPIGQVGTQFYRSGTKGRGTKIYSAR